MLMCDKCGKYLNQKNIPNRRLKIDSLDSVVEYDLCEDCLKETEQILTESLFKNIMPETSKEKYRYELEDLEGPDLYITREQLVSSIRKFIKQEVDIAITNVKLTSKGD